MIFKKKLKKKDRHWVELMQDWRINQLSINKLHFLKFNFSGLYKD